MRLNQAILPEDAVRHRLLRMPCAEYLDRCSLPEGGNTVSRETSLDLRIGLLENEVERLRLQLIVLTKALAKVIRTLKRL
jgi:hypothetical protein